MRDDWSESVWFKAPKMMGEKAPDRVDIKGIYRAQARAES
jgi:hypothetical protein